MGWACRKSGIAVARGQRLTGAATCARIAEHCAALLLLLRCVAALVGGLAPSFGSTTSNGHKRSSAPPLLLRPLLFRTNTIFFLIFYPVFQACTVPGLRPPPDPLFRWRGPSSDTLKTYSPTGRPAKYSASTSHPEASVSTQGILS